MNGAIIYRIGWRYLLRHPWQSILMVLGITLGVAVAVAIDLANASASQAFDLSTEAVVGKATHQIVGGPNKIDESIYALLKREEIEVAAAPVISEFGRSPELGNRTMQLLGVDPFSETPFRSYFGGENGFPVEQLTSFLTQPGAALISADLAEQFGFDHCDSPDQANISSANGCKITIEVAGQSQAAFISGLLKPDDPLSKRAVENLVLMDISTAQEITGQVGLLDRIDLILEPSCAGARLGEDCPSAVQIRDFLPPAAQLQEVEARTGAVEQMTAAFRLNLTALSLLALVVGMFLIYNTMTFSIVQRRQHFGTLRCLGVTRMEIFLIVLSEALVIGLLGALLGIVAGTIMGQGAVRLVTQTINDLFFVLTVRGVQIPAASLIKGVMLGVLATIFSAVPPAWEAATVPPRLALTRSSLETKVERLVIYAAGFGIFLLIAGTLALLIPTRNLVISFIATFAIIVGFALIAPLSTRLFMRAAIPVLGATLGSLGRMAPRDVVNSLSRTAVAIAALMVAVSVTIGVSLMVSSFRYTVITWLEQTLQGDIYISAPGLTATQPSAPLDAKVPEIVRKWPGVQRVDVLRSAQVDSPSGPVHVAATDNPTLVQERIFITRQESLEEISKAIQDGAVLLSEPFANRVGLTRVGEKLVLNTSSGFREFLVAGIYYDYASTEGTVLMNLSTYRAHWQDNTLTALALRLKAGEDADQVALDLDTQLQSIQRLQIRPNQVLRRDVLEVFDRTFTITGALQLLATLVAFIGILSALLSLQLERQRELGILRAIGMTTRQLWRLIMIETGLMGIVAGLLAMPAGFALAMILIYIINRRSFGWTLLLQVEAVPFLQAFLVAFLAALLAGVYPAIRMSRAVTSEALRAE